MDRGVPIRVVSRSIAVLQAVNRAGSLTMMDIAHASNVPYPTACRIVQTLVAEGLIEREPARKRYRPTQLVQTLSYGYQGPARLVTAARPHLVALTRQFGWPVSLTEHVGHNMIVRDSTHSLTSLTFNNYYPGYTLPLLDCASGLVFLANCADEERIHILKTLRDAPEQGDGATRGLMESGVLVREIRRDGYAVKARNLRTENPGKTSSIAVPVYGEAGVVGAMALVFFSSTLKITDAASRFMPALAAAAEATGASLLGGLGDDIVEPSAAGEQRRRPPVQAFASA